MNAKARPANIRQVGQEMDGVSEGFVRGLINSELSDRINCPTALAYLTILVYYYLLFLEVIMTHSNYCDMMFEIKDRKIVIVSIAILSSQIMTLIQASIWVSIDYC